MQVNTAAQQYSDLGLNKPATEEKGDTLGQAAFLELMTTQLKYQDPMKPMENGEFLTQIAQFGVNTGIQELNDSLSQFIKTNQSVRVVEAANMVGRSVLVPGDKARFETDGVLSGSIKVPEAVGDLQFTVVNENGVPVYNETVGSASKGMMNFNWFGQTNDGQGATAGKYTIKAEATVSGQRQALGTYVVTPVHSVAVNEDQVTLDLGEMGETTLDQVTRVL